jgi:hypothetical protein
MVKWRPRRTGTGGRRKKREKFVYGFFCESARELKIIWMATNEAATCPGTITIALQFPYFYMMVSLLTIRDGIKLSWNVLMDEQLTFTKEENVAMKKENSI